MFNAKYLVRLDKNSFADGFICLGKQLVIILNFLENELTPHIWYGANIDANFNTNFLEKYSSFFLKKIGNLSTLKNLAKEVDQFLFGVFIAIQKDYEFSDNSLQVDTEDDRFRPLGIEGVIIEIRAFDTSYFEIYSDDYQLIRKIADKYSTPILTSQFNSKHL